MFASFTAPDTLLYSSGAAVTLSNTTVGGESFNWTFDDGSSPIALHQPTVHLQNIGSVQVRLIASNSTGCSDTAVRTIVVADLALGVDDAASPGDLLVENKGEGQYLLTGKLLEENNTITLFDGGGKLIFTQTQRGPVAVNLDAYAPGLYYLQVFSGAQKNTVRLIRS